jgi:hypothetical protein
MRINKSIGKGNSQNNNKQNIQIDRHTNFNTSFTSRINKSLGKEGPLKCFIRVGKIKRRRAKCSPPYISAKVKRGKEEEEREAEEGEGEGDIEDDEKGGEDEDEEAEGIKEFKVDLLFDDELVP